MKIINNEVIKTFEHKDNTDGLILNGFIKTNNEFDSFNLKQIYDFNKKSFNVVGKADLTNSKINISKFWFPLKIIF